MTISETFPRDNPPDVEPPADDPGGDAFSRLAQTFREGYSPLWGALYLGLLGGGLLAWAAGKPGPGDQGLLVFVAWVLLATLLFGAYLAWFINIKVEVGPHGIWYRNLLVGRFISWGALQVVVVHPAAGREGRWFPEWLEVLGEAGRIRLSGRIQDYERLKVIISEKFQLLDEDLCPPRVLGRLSPAQRILLLAGGLLAYLLLFRFVALALV